MQSTSDFTQVTQVDRVRYLMHVLRKTQAQFAQLIGLDPANLSRALKPDTPLREGLMNRIVVNVGVSKEWLRSGVGEPFLKGMQPMEITEGKLMTPAFTHRIAGAPVYDIDVTAGAQELSLMFTDERIIGHLDMPGINREYPVVRVSGDSMQPRIANGAYVSIREVNVGSPIFWGQIYVVVLDDYRMVKYVRRHQDPELVILHSDNPRYDDMEVPRRLIRRLYMVETILNYDIVG